MTKTSQLLLQATGLCHQYRDGEQTMSVLNHVNLSVHPSDVTAIVGVSGSGKTTLLNILAGYLRPSQGQVLFNGQDLFEMTSREIAQFRSQTIGFIYQRHYMIRELTALENVTLPLMIQKNYTLLKATQKAALCLKSVGLCSHCDYYAHQLSGGQRQRVAVARALVTEPSIIFADEPTGSLDPSNSQQLMELLLNLNASQRSALVIVTHDMSIASLCSQKLLLK